MFNIAKFVAEINATGIAKASNFEVFIIRGKGSPIEQSLLMRCNSVELPGRSIMSADISNYGPSVRIGYGTQFAEATASIIVSEDLREKEFFDAWQDDVLGKYRTVTANADLQTQFDIGYYDDYVGTVEIRLYNDVGDVSYKVKLINAYPISLGSLGLSWQDSNSIIMLPVVFTFKYLTNGE